MQYTVNRNPKGKIDIKIDVPKTVFDETYKTVLEKLSTDVNISGFRPGKAPADVVEKHVGISKVLNETAGFLVNKHLSEIFEKEKLLPIDSPKIAIDVLAQSSPFSYTVSFTQKPEVKIGEWKKLKIARVKAKEITEVDVLESIKNIFEAWSKQRETKDNKQETEAGNEENKGKFIYDAQGNKIFVGDEKGAADKQSLRSSSNQDSTAGLKKIPNKVEEYHIDDEFAKAIGARDLNHLKEIVMKDLESIVADQVEAKLEQEIFEKLSEISTLEIPEILIEDELNRILVRLSNQLEQQGRDLDSYLKEQKMTIDELKNKWREQAGKNVKTTLIMDVIGRQEKIQVSKEEIDTAMKGVGETNLSAEQRQDFERYMALSIFQAKTLDLVKKTIAAT